MSDATANWSLPYQEENDAPDGPSLGQDLAEAVDAALTTIDNKVAAVNAMATAGAKATNTEGPTSSVTMTPGGTVCGTTFVAPASGQVMVHLKAYFQQNATDNVAIVSTEIRAGSTIGSGAVVSGGTANGNDALAIGRHVGSGEEATLNAGTPRWVSGLTPGNTYNVRTMHQTTSGGSITLFYREVIVVPML